jgi:hypothetical protein
MTSLELQGSQSGFRSLVGTFALPLVLAGFIGTTGTALWSYTRSTPAISQSTQTTSPTYSVARGQSAVNRSTLEVVSGGVGVAVEALTKITCENSFDGLLDEILRRL